MYEKLIILLEKRLEKLEKRENDTYELISYYDKKIAKLSENNILISLYKYLYKFTAGVLKKKIEEQSKEEIFEYYKRRYFEITTK